ncbi:hypothetical protein E2C01_024839 [Portunus trituberculatus]|uniref:Uncharacterized protein n=1 Tax=Portunus trituberculatus TaxID=210409 RepID=A0A5B7EG87_PORTR|nr:hypothetical protein [Portunus trituberculatus]
MNERVFDKLKNRLGLIPGSRHYYLLYAQHTEMGL